MTHQPERKHNLEWFSSLDKDVSAMPRSWRGFFRLHRMPSGWGRPGGDSTSLAWMEVGAGNCDRASV